MHTRRNNSLKDHLNSNVNIVYAQYMHVDRKSVLRNPVGEISRALRGEPNKFVYNERQGRDSVFAIYFIVRDIIK